MVLVKTTGQEQTAVKLSMPPNRIDPKNRQYIVFKIEEHTRAGHRAEGLCIVPFFRLNPWGRNHSFVMEFF